jgi:hypothetical protein
LITCLVAAALAIGYVCETGLPFWRRAAASVLGLFLAVGAGQLLTSADPAVGYAMGIPSLLVLGVIMIAPERKPRRAPSPGRRVTDQPRPAVAAVPSQFDRRASRRRSPLALGTDPRITPHTSPVVEIARMAPALGNSGLPMAARASNGAAAGARADQRRQGRQGRRGAPRSLSRIPCHRCR